MGGGSWSDAAYNDRAKVRSARVATGGAAFAYTDSVDKGVAPRAVHDDMDPRRVAGPTSPFAGKVMRESRDSANHPESLAVVVVFDVTGSMGTVPVALERKLKGLMSLIVSKGYAAHPQILFGASGDANSDHAPLQVGQFESDATMDDDLDKIWVEGNGGGQQSETYELGHYFVARHTATDCWEKRGKKGYYFSIGDENYYPAVKKEQVRTLIGDTLQANLPTEEIVAELSERWHVFHIIAEQGAYPHNVTIESSWKRLLGERVLKLEDSDNVAELIATTIGLCEGTVDLDDARANLLDAGADAKTIDTVTKALVPYAAATALAKGSVTGDLPDAGPGGATTRI